MERTIFRSTLLMLIVFCAVLAHSQTEESADKKAPLTKRLWGGYDSNAIEKNLIIKDAFVTEGEKLLEGVGVQILINNSAVKTMTTDKEGGFKTNLQFDYKYILAFSKTGYVTKKIEIDLTDIPVEFKNEGYDLGRFQLGMVRYVEGMDAEEYNTPVARYYFDIRTSMVTLDRAYLKKKRKEVEKQKARNEKVVANAADEQDELQEEYNVLIRDADIEFEAKDYQLAKSYYQDAIKLKPLAEYPRAQLEIINGLLDVKLVDDEKYDALISQANEAFDLKEYEESKSLYLASIKIKTTEPFPRERIEKIDELIANQKKPELKKPKDELSLKDVQISSDRASFCSDLARKYPQGLTEEKYMEGSKSVVRRIIVDGDIGVEYKHVTHNWGGSYFFKNGKPTTRFTWQKEAMQY